MTPEAKKLLSSTVRALRARLLADLDAAHDRARQQAAYAALQRLVLQRSLRPASIEADPETTEAALATDFPGLFGDHAGLVPAATLRHVAARLDQPGLASCWTDELTLGWVHQYWNDPEREALDARLSARGKLEPHEVASKTQLFTERYMVDWLLHNTLGPMWLAICHQHGWVPEVQASGTLAALETRRAGWRDQQRRGEVTPTALMPLHTPLERRWAYYIDQPLPADAPAQAPASVRDLRLLDPAVGAGHFLVLAFDLLFALYQEEARHRGEAGDPRWSPRAIVESILERNLHGLDLDPRAVQIAAAALVLKARHTCPEARPRLNLVAADLQLASLERHAPALVALRRDLESDAGIPAAATDTLVDALRCADHLGSLLRIDALIDHTCNTTPNARNTLLRHLETFLAASTRSDDLGLRLQTPPLPAGVRFLRLLREDHYHLVVGNPPYQGTARLADSSYIQNTYTKGKADLYAAFLERGLQLARPGGMSALLTMRSWMFLQQYTELRQWLLEHHDLRTLGDFDRGAFDDLPDERVSVVASVFRRAPPGPEPGVALQPTPRDDHRRDGERTSRKHAAVLAQVGRHEFHPEALRIVPEWPLVHWWDGPLLKNYHDTPKLGEHAPARKGLCTGDDTRTCRFPWELSYTSPKPNTDAPLAEVLAADWVPTIMGGKGRAWIEPLTLLLKWRHRGLENKVMHEARWGSHTKRIQNESFYARRGVAFAMIGPGFCARVHRFPSIFGNMGSSVFTADLAGTVASMNSTLARSVLTSLNPGMHFEVGDVNRLPLFPIPDADKIYKILERAFTEHESHREPSVEFQHPGPSPWRHAQAWAQRAVDRPADTPLPAYTLTHDPEPTTDHLSYALGLALGRFTGTLGPLPAGILFLDGTLAPDDPRDSLGHAAAAPLHAAHPPKIRTYLSKFFFPLHRKMYENRPIHWPLSSAERTFVAWVTIHRWTADTLQILLADHLLPALARIDTRPVSTLFKKARAELVEFIATTRQLAEKGPLPAPGQPAREVDAAYDPCLDDGVRVNAAPLWPLLAPQWKDPRLWWQQLAAGGKQHADWSRLAMRYWPTRVDARCQRDPSLAVAHGCFYKYHPARAWAWELRLQDEIGPTFRLAEGPYRGDGGHEAHRRGFLAEQAAMARAIADKEALRRQRKQRAQVITSST